MSTRNVTVILNRKKSFHSPLCTKSATAKAQRIALEWPLPIVLIDSKC
jgi:hypothetical protein